MNADMLARVRHDDGFDIGREVGACHGTRPVPVPCASFTVAATFSVLGAVLLAIVAWRLVRRAHTRKAFHFFISYRVKTDVALDRIALPGREPHVRPLDPVREHDEVDPQGDRPGCPRGRPRP